MEPWVIGAIGIVMLFVIIFAGLPLGFGMIMIGFVGYIAVAGPKIALSQMQLNAVSAAMDYNLSCLPFFIVMGEFAFVSGMVQSSYRAAYKWLGGLPGGLAMASIGGAAIFSTVSGSSIACAAVMTKIALPDLIKHKYNPQLAVGSLAAGGTLGSLIPPGTSFIIYSMLTQESIGALFMASMIPGVVLTLMYFAQIYLQCKMDPTFGPPGPKTSWREKITALKDVWMMLVLFGIVIGGIWFGIYTPTEAATIGAVGAFLFAVGTRKLTKANLYHALLEAIKTTGMIFIIVIGAKLFTYFSTISGLLAIVANWVVSLNLHAIWLVVFIMVMYFFLGIALDTLSMILLTLPILLPILVAAHINLIWFGVLVVTQMELSQITPPVGLILFTIAGMVKDVGISMGQVFKGVLPYCITMIIFNAILIVVPSLCLWLPSTMRGG
jgi:C4-dicarboxylate transporter, DctM subunit